MPAHGQLETIIAEVPLQEGVDLKTNAKLVLPTKLLKLEDGVFQKGGELRERNGYVKLATDVLGGAAIADGHALGRYKDELLLFNAGALFSRSIAIAKWVSKGGVTPFAASAEVLSARRTSASNPDAARHSSGVAVYAWTDASGGVRATVRDEETGTLFLADTQISATGTRPRCVVIGNHLFVVYIDGANLRARRISVAAPSAFDAAVLLRVDVELTASQAHLDVIAFTPAGAPQASAMFAYTTDVSIVVGYLLENGIVGDGATGFAGPQTILSTAEQALTLHGNSDPLVWGNAIVIWANAGALSAAGITGESLAIGATQVLAARGDVVNVTATSSSTVFNEQIHVFYEITHATPTKRQVWWLECDSGGSGSAGVLLRRGVGLASKAFSRGTNTDAGGVVSVAVVFAGTLQSTFFLLSVYVSGGAHVHAIRGRLLALNAGGLQEGALPSVFSPATDQYAWAAPVKTRFVVEGQVAYSEIGIARSGLAFDGAGQYRGAQAGDAFLVAGGQLGGYDGAALIEHGFHVFPEGVVAADAVQNAAGGFMAPGTYSFCWIYEWYDAKGQCHRSSPSVPVAVVVPAGTNTNRVSFATVPTLRLSEKTGVRIVMYSTEKEGLVYYRTPHQAGTAVAGVANDAAVDVATYERTVADATISSGEILYSQGVSGATGGELENICPPAASLIAVGKSRAVIAGLEDPLAYWYSKPILAGKGVSFSDSLQGRVEPSGGGITAVAFLDDKLVLFKRDQMYVVFGDGPDATGQADSFSKPQLVTTDVGCTESRSVVAGPDGLFFKSAKGIYLLTRELKAVYIGAEVEFYNDQEIVAATLDDDANQIRFLVAPLSTEVDGARTTRTLVYDYFFRQWSTFTNHEGADAAIFDGVYHYLRANGEVWREDPDVGLDGDGRGVRMLFKIAWQKFGSIQGFKRVRRCALLGDFLSTHKLRGAIYRDYRDFPEDEFTFDPAPTQAGGAAFGDGNFGDGNFGGEAQIVADRVYQMRHHLKHQKVQAISIEVWSEGNTPGKAYSISALSFEFAVLRGLARLPAAKTV